MKKIIIFFLIISINLSHLSVGIVYGQSSGPSSIDLRHYSLQCGPTIAEEIAEVDEEQIQACANQFGISDLDSLKRCVGTNGINTQCVARNFSGSNLDNLLACLNDAVANIDFMPMLVPSGGKGMPKFSFKQFLELLKQQIITEVLNLGLNKIMGVINSLISGLLGGFLSTKVPTDDKGAQGILGKSVEETVKNTFSQIQAGINLGLQDAQNYLAFKAKATLESAIYEKIFKNFIPDIQQYRYLRLYQAYARAVDKILEPYTKQSNITCLPVEVKTCVYTLLNEAAAKANVYIGRSESPRLTKRLFKSLQRTNRFSIINKPNCDPNDPNTYQIYRSLGLTPKLITGQSSATLTANIKPTQSLIAKVEIQKPSLLARTFNFIANPFNSINLKLLLGQANQNQNNQGKLIDPATIAENVIEMANCNFIFNSSTEKIFKELENEISTFNAYIGQPGATNFKPKTACLKTAAEANLETLNKQKEDLIRQKGASSTEVLELENTIRQYQQIAEQQRKAGISGESPLCLKSGEVENPISTYENMREKITKGTLDFFENREGATNIIVSYIRGWINSELFKLIDQGFAKLYKGKSDELFVKSNLEEAYSEKRRNQICGVIPNDMIPLKNSCDNIFNLNKETLANLTVFELQDQLIQVKNSLKLITDLQSKIDSYATTMASGTNALIGYTAGYSLFGAQPPAVLGNIIQELQSILSQINTASSTLNGLVSSTQNILGFASGTLEQINLAIQNLENSTTAREITEISSRINQLQEQTASITQKIQGDLQLLSRETANPRIQSIFNLLSQRDSNIYAGFFREGGFSGYIGIQTTEGTANRRLTLVTNDRSIGRFIDDGRLTLGNSEALSFYDYFYPGLIRQLANNIAGGSHNFYNNVIQINEHLDYILGRSENNIYSSPPHVAAEIARVIFLSLFKTDISAVETEQQLNLVGAITNRLNDLFSGNPNATITDSDLNKLKNFFENLELIASKTLDYINSNPNSFSNDANNRNKNFSLKVVIPGSEMEHSLNFQQTFSVILNISKPAKNILTEIQNNNLLNTQLELNNLNTRLTELRNAYNKEIERILNESGVDREVLNSKIQEAKNLEAQLKELDKEVNNLCFEYNDNLSQGEIAFNTYLRNLNTGGSPPPDEESGGGGSSGQINNSVGKRLALIVKGLIANVFEPFNFFKPRQVKIK